MRAAHKLDLLQNLLSMFLKQMIKGWGGGGGGGGGRGELKGVSLKRHAATSEPKNHETDLV